MKLINSEKNISQDPNNLEKFNMEQFHHVKLDLKTKEQIEKEKKEMQVLFRFFF